LLRFVRWVWALIKNTVENDLHNHAGEMAYFAIMSVFPFFLLLLSAVAFLDIPDLFNQVMSLLETVAPGSVVQVLESTVYDVTTVQQTNLLSLTAVVALWWSLGAMSSTIRGLNKAFGMLDPRHYVHFFGLTILLTLLLGGILVISIVLIMLGPVIHNEVSSRVDVGWFGDILISVFRYGVASFFLLLGHAGIYWLCPAVERHFRLLTPGSLFSAAGWVVVSYGLQQYLRHFNNYNKVYGSLGAVILTLFWFYLMSFVLLLGGQIDAMLHPEYKARGQATGKRPDYVLSRFPFKLAGTTLILAAIAFFGTQFIIKPGFFTPKPHMIGGPTGEAIKLGIVEGTEKVAHGELALLLERYVDDEGLVDYDGLREARPLLDAYIQRLGEVDLARVEKSHMLAMMINLFNAGVLKLVVDHSRHVDSVKDIQSYAARRSIALMGEKISLDKLEHDVLRAYFQDPRYHFAICRGNRGLPRLQREAFDGDRLDAQLERVTHEVLGASAVQKNDKVIVPRLMQEYAADFAVDGRVAPFLLRYVGDEAKKLLLDKRERADAALTYRNLDWTLNERQPLERTSAPSDN
jgi:membrane protein